MRYRPSERSGEAGRASSKFFSNVISDACMDAKYGRTWEIFEIPPVRGRAYTSTIRVLEYIRCMHVTDTHHCVPSCTRETTTPRETIYEHIEAQNCPRALKNFKWETPSAMMRLGCGGKSSGCRTPRPTLSAWRRKRCVSNRYHKLPVHNYTKYLLPSALLCSTHLELS